MTVRRLWGIAAAIIIVFFSRNVSAQFGPAPEGDATVVAQKSIRDNFDENDCPLVVEARRFGDGSIRALCNNGETYRVFGSHYAMRCSAVAALGIHGC